MCDSMNTSEGGHTIHDHQEDHLNSELILQELLSEILLNLEKYNTDNEIMKEYERNLSSADNIHCLLECIKRMFSQLMHQIEKQSLLN